MHLNNWCEGWLLKLCVHKFRVPCLIFGIAGFVLYWGVPLLFSAQNHTLFTAERQKTLKAHQFVQSPTAASLLPLRAQVPAGLKLSYLQDKNHMIFALLLIPGAAMVPLILRGMKSTINKLLADNVITNPLQARQTYITFQKYSNHWIGKFISLFLATASLSIFLNFYLNPDYSYWWGSGEYGSAGLALSLIEFGMVYFGTQAMFHVGFGAAALGAIARENINPRLFHHDGCGGLSSLGELIICIWIFSIALAAEILVTVKLGYLGIEYWPATWLLAFIGICVLPFIGLYPLYCCIRSLSSAKCNELKAIELPIASFYSTAQSLAADRRYAEAAEASDRAGKLIALYNYLIEINIWPFNRRAFYLIGIVYLTQFGMTMLELFKVS